jgi:hypothetical protein
MEAFYKITILVAIVFLILALTVIGILMGKKANVLIYPPVMNECPDYWTYDGSYCIVPNKGCPTSSDPSKFKDCSGNVLNGLNTITSVNTQNTPGIKFQTNPDKSTTVKIDFKDAGWTGTCAQMQWANKNNIVWDGVSNYNSC